MTTQDQIDSKLTRKEIRKRIKPAERPRDPRTITPKPVIARKYAKQWNNGLIRQERLANKERTPEDEARLAAAQAKRDRKAGKSK